MLNCISGKFQSLVSCAVGTQIANQFQYNIFCHDIFGQLPGDIYPDCFWDTNPECSCTEDACHLRISDARRESTDTAISRRMAVCTKHDIARFDIPCFRHQLVADPIRAMDIFHAIFLHKFIANPKMSGIVHLTCGHQMVIDQHRLVCVPDFGKSHLLKLGCHKWYKNIMYHHAVHIHCHNLAGVNLFACVVSHNLLYYC